MHFSGKYKSRGVPLCGHAPRLKGTDTAAISDAVFRYGLWVLLSLFDIDLGDFAVGAAAQVDAGG